MNRRTLLATLILGAAALPAAAHHSFSMFDAQKEVVLKGTVKEFQWSNPHTWIQVIVTDEAGKQTEWSLEGGSPGILGRNGWKRTSLKAGERIPVEIYPMKDGTPGGSFIEITKADGSRLYYHG